MITSKERKVLSSYGQKIDPVFQIGKNGITRDLLTQISDFLEKNELIKINVLKNSDLMPKELINELATKLKAEPVSCVGSKIVLYRESKRKDVKHIDLDIKKLDI